jgi:hypothetical protein
LKNNRKLLAYTVAILADAIQLPFSLIAFSGVMLPVAEGVVLFVDIVAMLLLTALIGFDWILLPSFAVEAVIGLDAFPTWTLAVAYLTRRKKKENTVSHATDGPPVIDVEATHVSPRAPQISGGRS